MSKELQQIDKSDLLVSSDYNSLYASAVAHKASKRPKIETATAIDKENRPRLCDLYNNTEWKVSNKLGLFKV